MLQMENIVVALAEGSVSKDLLHRVTISLIEEDDFSDELKLELAHAMSHGVFMDGGNEDL
jgi:hypothetical protein